MKKDRNCGMNYPMYPNYMPMTPINPNMISTPMNSSMMTPMAGDSIEQQLNTMSNKISNLERRVTSLESLVGNTNNYSNNGYQMM